MELTSCYEAMNLLLEIAIGLHNRPAFEVWVSEEAIVYHLASSYNLMFN